MMRILFDLTATGKKIVEKCFDIKLESEPWNRGAKDVPHVASIMLTREMLIPLGIFALLESGCTEVWQDRDQLFAAGRASAGWTVFSQHKTLTEPKTFDVFRFVAGFDPSRHAALRLSRHR
jgi:hypothetical protein